MHFSSVYYRAQQKLLVLAGSDVDDLTDLAGETGLRDATARRR